MPDKKSPEKNPAEQKSGGPKKAIMSASICFGLVAVGYFVGGKFSAAAPAAAEGTAVEAEGAAVEEVELEPVVGETIALDPININLAEGRYLRIAVSLGLDEHVLLEEPSDEEVVLPLAPASDAILSTFSGMSMVELATVEGREEAREHLIQALEPFYGENIVAVYDTEFVMQ